MSELGPVISEHKGRFAAGGVGWYIGGLMFGAGIVGIVNALAAGEFMSVPGLLFFVSLAGLWLLWLFAKWKQTLTIHQLGFVHRRIVGAPRVVRFDEVAQVDIYRVASRQSLHLKGIHVELTLFLHAGGKIKLTNDITDIEQLATYAQPGGVAAGGPSSGGAIPQNPSGGGPSPWG